MKDSVEHIRGGELLARALKEKGVAARMNRWQGIWLMAIRG